MKVLLDTCVLAELVKKDQMAVGVKKLFEQLSSEDIFISVISMGEINKGIHLLPNSKRKIQLQSWYLTLVKEYEDHILGVNLEMAELWGELAGSLQKKGITLSAADGLIAVSAITNGLHVVTRNIKDFQHTPALLLNPCE